MLFENRKSFWYFRLRWNAGLIASTLPQDLPTPLAQVALRLFLHAQMNRKKQRKKDFLLWRKNRNKFALGFLIFKFLYRKTFYIAFTQAKNSRSRLFLLGTLTGWLSLEGWCILVAMCVKYIWWNRLLLGIKMKETGGVLSISNTFHIWNEGCGPNTQMQILT